MSEVSGSSGWPTNYEWERGGGEWVVVFVSLCKTLMRTHTHKEQPATKLWGTFKESLGIFIFGGGRTKNISWLGSRFREESEGSKQE